MAIDSINFVFDIDDTETLTFLLTATNFGEHWLMRGDDIWSNISIG